MVPLIQAWYPLGRMCLAYRETWNSLLVCFFVVFVWFVCLFFEIVSPAVQIGLGLLM